MHGKPAARAIQVLAVGLADSVAVAVEIAVQGGDVKHSMLGRVAVAAADDSGVPLAAKEPEGFPGREQLGGLELELLHRDSGHEASFGDDLSPRARQPGGPPASPRPHHGGPGIARHLGSAGPRTWCTLLTKRTVRLSPYNTHPESVNAGKPRLISTNLGRSPPGRKAG